jgi:hypothetical protein
MISLNEAFRSLLPDGIFLARDRSTIKLKKTSAAVDEPIAHTVTYAALYFLQRSRFIPSSLFYEAGDSFSAIFPIFVNALMLIHKCFAISATTTQDDSRLSRASACSGTRSTSMRPSFRWPFAEY